MNNLARHPAGFTKAEQGQHRARTFIGQRCVIGASLVVPAWPLWIAYEQYCRENGLLDGNPKELRALIDSSPWGEWIELPNARGKLKAIVKGVGLRAPEDKQ